METELEPPYEPNGDPVPLEELAKYTPDGEVAVTRGDVFRAIATADEELKTFLQATQKNN